MSIKKLVILISTVLISALSFNGVYAAQPSLTFYPSSGVVSDIEKGFTVDVLKRVLTLLKLVQGLMLRQLVF